MALSDNWLLYRSGRFFAWSRPGEPLVPCRSGFALVAFVAAGHVSFPPGPVSPRVRSLALRASAALRAVNSSGRSWSPRPFSCSSCCLRVRSSWSCPCLAVRPGQPSLF